MRSIYISCHHPDPANQLAAELEAAGHKVVSTWHRVTGSRPDKDDVRAWGQKAEDNFNQIDDADALVLIASPEHLDGTKRVPGGKFVEAGYAFGSIGTVFTVGGVENGLMHYAKAYTTNADLIRNL